MEGEVEDGSDEQEEENRKMKGERRKGRNREYVEKGREK